MDFKGSKAVLIGVGQGKIAQNALLADVHNLEPVHSVNAYL